jgi:hypothetical protein
MAETNVSKSYVRPDNTVVITCPHCNRQRVVNVESFKQHKFRFSVKCACKKIFTAQIEFRQRVRKITRLMGTYTNLTRKNISGNMTVRNLSVSGLELHTYDNIQNFSVGDEILVEFNLDDEHQTEISREVIVREIRKDSIGCEFSEHGSIALDGPLGTYLTRL